MAPSEAPADPPPRPLPKPKKPAKRGYRLPAGWLPSEADVKFARDRGWTDDQINDTAGQFCDHFTAAPGRYGLKLDWHATWRNWVRNAEQYGLVPGDILARDDRPTDDPVVLGAREALAGFRRAERNRG